jgi:hypothetical protein
MGRRGMLIGYWWERQKVRNYREDQDVGGCIIERLDDMHWIHLAKDRDQWRALVNTVFKIRVP